jgi:hypothetical protein
VARIALRVIGCRSHPFVVIRLSIALLVAAQQLGAQDPAILQIRVIEGEAAVYAAGARATRGVTVQVTDETGKPVDGATVSFRLPEDGPSGSFASGGKTEIVTTKPDGRAAAWGMQWNRNVGLLDIRITAVKGQTRAGIVCPQYLTGAAEAAASKSKANPAASGGSHKLLWILVGVAGAAGGAVAAAAVGGKTSAGSTPSTGVQIGAPSITLGHP